MRKPGSVKGLEELGRVRLSPSFFPRDFLHSEIDNFHGLPNIPDDPDLATPPAAGCARSCWSRCRRGSAASRSARPIVLRR